MRAALEDAPKIGESLCDECRSHFDAVRAATRRSTACPTCIDPTLVRGLDYYSRTTFEFIGPDENANSTICGGGRYDGLVEQIGGPPTPAIGFGAGLERLLLALENEGVTVDAAGRRRVLRRRRPRVRATVLCRRSRELRRAGVSADTDYAGRSFKGQMTQAGRSGARHGRDRSRRRRDDRSRRTRASSRSLLARSSLRSRRELARPLLRRTRDRAHRQAGDRRRLGGHAARPRRARLHRPARPHRQAAARRSIRSARPRQRQAAHEIRNEFVLQAEGEVVARAPEPVNPNLPTGEVEMQVDKLRILSRSTPLPFQLDEENVDETLRLRYRWLDMRRDRMQRNFRLRTRDRRDPRAMDAQDFIDVWTPSMTRGTPEGARDFLVPVRLQPGKFFALAQSPQIFKQLCMVGGFDRYYQIATCWRDEDLRADRQFEFRQLDLEMAFVEREDVLDVMETPRSLGRSRRSAARRRRGRSRGSSFDEAMARYGSDKPDLRFGLEIQDATELTRGVRVRRLRERARRFVTSSRRKAFSRGELAQLEELAKEWGAKGLAYIVVRRGRRGPLADREVPLAGGARRRSRRARLDGALRRRRATRAVLRVLGFLRLHLGRELGLIDDRAWTSFTGCIDFPLFEQDEESGAWTFMHHPFTAPVAGARSGTKRARPGARAALRPHLERVGARLRLDPHPRRRGAAAGVPRTIGLTEEEARRSSASCSTRSRWARRRTVASRWGSSASSR